MQVNFPVAWVDTPNWSFRTYPIKRGGSKVLFFCCYPNRLTSVKTGIFHHASITNPVCQIQVGGIKTIVNQPVMIGIESCNNRVMICRHGRACTQRGLGRCVLALIGQYCKQINRVCYRDSYNMIYNKLKLNANKYQSGCTYTIHTGSERGKKKQGSQVVITQT